MKSNVLKLALMGHEPAPLACSACPPADVDSWSCQTGVCCGRLRLGNWTPNANIVTMRETLDVIVFVSGGGPEPTVGPWIPIDNSLLTPTFGGVSNMPASMEEIVLLSVGMSENHARMGKVGGVLEEFSSRIPNRFIRRSRQPLGAWARNREA
jgi:hypothetical protein